MSRRLHVWWYLSVNAFKFQSCDHTPPRTRSLTVSLGLRASPPPGWYRLGREIKRYLIIVYPRTFALDQRDAARGPPALPGVLAGSSYFTRPRRIPPAPRRPLSRLSSRREPSLPSCAGLCSEPAVSAPLSSQWHVSYRWLRAFQLQQRKRRLSVMELPRLLAPCSPTNRVPGQFYSPAIRDTRTRPNSSSLPRAAAHWAICAPAASLRTMGRLSCPFSGAEPSFPGRVTSPVAPYATGSMMRQKRDADA